MTSMRRFTRRAFIKSTIGASAAAPFILPSHIWAAQTKPNDRLTLGFIGMGTQNRGLLSGFLRKTETQAVAVCDVDTTRRDNAKKTIEDSYAKESGHSYKGCDPYR